MHSAIAAELLNLAKLMSKTKIQKSPLEGLHPKQHPINVVMTDGSTFQILTSWGKEGDTLKLDVDPKSHQAWQDEIKNFVDENNQRVAKFRGKFGDFGLKKKVEAVEVVKAVEVVEAV